MIRFSGVLFCLVLLGTLRSPANAADITENSKLVAADAAMNDQFGVALAVHSGTAVVGSWHDDNSILAAGAAYLFQKAPNSPWTQYRKLLASDGAAGDEFGAAVHLSNDTLAVGAPGEDATGSEAGAVYIFGREEGGPNNWGETAKLFPDSAAGRMGLSVALSGDTLVVGAPGDRSPGLNTGAVYIFERNRGGMNTWGLTKKIAATDASAEAAFGSSVAVSGNTVLVGAPGSGHATGSAYLFERHQGGTDQWGQVVRLLAADAASSNHFGQTVSLLQDVAAVGAPAHDRSPLPGAAYVFARHQGGNNAWGQVRRLQGSVSTPGAQFGRSLALAGESLVVGSPTESRAGDRAGAAFIFARHAGGSNNWGQVQILSGTDTSALFEFGHAVAAADNTVLVGAPGDRHSGVDSGSTYVYSLLSETPRLTIRALTTTTALVAWEPADAAFHLERTASLEAPAWVSVPTSSNSLVVTTSGTSQFYRLVGPSSFVLEFVPVRNPGNAPDSTGFGGLEFGFQIGRYEVSNDEYAQFLNAVAVQADPFALYNPLMTTDPRGGIVRSGSAGNFQYASKPLFGNKPVIFVSFYDALRFANWLHNGQPRGVQNSLSTEDGAYLFSGASTVGSRKPTAKVWLPSEDEWYKAAYFDGVKGSNGGYWRYPTRSDTAPAVATTDSSGNINNGPNNVANYESGALWSDQVGHLTTVGSAGVGSRSYYGAADMGGNVAEWNENQVGLLPGIRGGSWVDFESGLESLNASSQSPLTEVDTVGFRVARP